MSEEKTWDQVFDEIFQSKAFLCTWTCERDHVPIVYKSYWPECPLCLVIDYIETRRVLLQERGQHSNELERVLNRLRKGIDQMSILWFWEEEEKKSSPGGLIVRREKWQAVKTIAIMAATLRPHVKELFVRPGDKPQWILELGRDESAFDEIAVDWAYELFKKANERIK